MNILNIKWSVFWCLIGIFFSTTDAVADSLPQKTFNISKANHQFERIKLQRTNHDLDLSALEKSVNILSHLMTSAENCVENALKQQNSVAGLIQQGSLIEKNAPQQGVDLIYLQKEQKNWSNRQAQCRLLLILAKEESSHYKTAIIELKKAQALAHTPPFWSLSQQVWRWFNNAEQPIMRSFVVPWPNIASEWLTSIPILALAGAWFILWVTVKNTFFHRQMAFKKIHLRHLWLLFFWLLSFFVVLHELNSTSESLLWYRWAVALFSYSSGVIGLTLLFKIKKINAFFHWNGLNIRFFQKLALIVLTGYTFFYGLKDLFHPALTSDFISQWVQACSLFLVLLFGIYFLHSFCRLHRNVHVVKKYRVSIEGSGTLLLISCVILNTLGYQTLTYRLTTSTLVSLSIVFFTILVIHGIAKLHITLSINSHWKNKLHRFFGYRCDQTMVEFLILKFILQGLVIALSIYFIGQCWDFATDFTNRIFDPILEGIHWSKMTFYPARMVLGAVIFCLVYLFFRALSTTIGRHHQYQEEDTQVAIASILTYLGFGIAAITGLLVAGFNFTGLAIVAGALSVGIGLGLQSIVNNFVSGLILLIEKPIRPGDRINVDGVEGFVKKIRVRSTQLITPYREDIIIPNSDLITHRVTNFMFSDTFGRICCEVGVAYENNADEVRSLLLEVATAHDAIVKQAPNAPTVVFRAFADNKLVFQLWGMIHDVNKKSAVQSDLNFAINAIFRKHHIQFPKTQPMVMIQEPI